MLFLSIGIISQYKYSSVEAWQGFLSPNVIKGKNLIPGIIMLFFAR